MKIISTICFLALSTITLGAEGSATLVIENAIVDDRDGTDDDLVNLIVKDGRLVLITSQYRFNQQCDISTSVLIVTISIDDNIGAALYTGLNSGVK